MYVPKPVVMQNENPGLKCNGPKARKMTTIIMILINLLKWSVPQNPMSSILFKSILYPFVLLFGTCVREHNARDNARQTMPELIQA